MPNRSGASGLVGGSCSILLLVTMLVLPASFSFTLKIARSPAVRVGCSRLFSSSSSLLGVEGVSRLSTLQTMLSRFGAPGSTYCNQSDDLEPVAASQGTPELLASMTDVDEDELSNLHPYLYPIVRSKSSGNFICALRNAYADEAEINVPWPIVEAKLGGPGMQLLSLNSEHLMRRIACEKDFAGDGKEAVEIYNDGLGEGLLKDKAFDDVYVPGDVEKLG